MRKTIDSYIDQIGKEVEAIDWRQPEMYAAYCAQLYYYVRHSTRILALGASRMPLAENTAHNRYLAHLAEEKNHEILARRDCASVGFEIEDFPELPATRCFYQTQYYMNLQVSPWAFLGYALLLEGMALRMAHSFGNKIESIHGPKTASFMKVHGNEDEEHLAQAVALLETRPENERKIILESAELSFYLHTQMFRDLKTAVAQMREQKKKAA